MYHLTLGKAERDAFDWVGNRYNAGEVSTILRRCLPPDTQWDQDGEITFAIPEHQAWTINELAEQEDHSWPCFAPQLAGKLVEFCQQII